MVKLRIYQLARELKVDSKELVEETRRMGCDVSTPSHSVSVEVAQKLREKYSGKNRSAGEGLVD